MSVFINNADKFVARKSSPVSWKTFQSKPENPFIIEKRRSTNDFRFSFPYLLSSPLFSILSRSLSPTQPTLSIISDNAINNPLQ